MQYKELKGGMNSLQRGPMSLLVLLLKNSLSL